MLFFLNIIQLSPIIGQEKYPNIEAIFTKSQLDSMLNKFQSSQDTLGLGYTYWAYSKNEEKAGGINNSPIVCSSQFNPTYKMNETIHEIGDEINLSIIIFLTR